MSRRTDLGIPLNANDDEILIINETVPKGNARSAPGPAVPKRPGPPVSNNLAPPHGARAMVSGEMNRGTPYPVDVRTPPHRAPLRQQAPPLVQAPPTLPAPPTVQAPPTSRAPPSGTAENPVELESDEEDVIVIDNHGAAEDDNGTAENPVVLSDDEDIVVFNSEPQRRPPGTLLNLNAEFALGENPELPGPSRAPQAPPTRGPRPFGGVPTSAAPPTPAPGPSTVVPRSSQPPETPRAKPSRNSGSPMTSGTLRGTVVQPTLAPGSYRGATVPKKDLQASAQQAPPTGVPRASGGSSGLPTSFGASALTSRALPAPSEEATRLPAFSGAHRVTVSPLTQVPRFSGGAAVPRSLPTSTTQQAPPTDVPRLYGGSSGLPTSFGALAAPKASVVLPNPIPRPSRVASVPKKVLPASTTQQTTPTGVSRLSGGPSGLPTSSGASALVPVAPSCRKKTPEPVILSTVSSTSTRASSSVSGVRGRLQKTPEPSESTPAPPTSSPVLESEPTSSGAVQSLQKTPRQPGAASSNSQTIRGLQKNSNSSGASPLSFQASSPDNGSQSLPKKTPKPSESAPTPLTSSGKPFQEGAAESSPSPSDSSSSDSGAHRCLQKTSGPIQASPTSSEASTSSSRVSKRLQKRQRVSEESSFNSGASTSSAPMEVDQDSEDVEMEEEEKQPKAKATAARRKGDQDYRGLHLERGVQPPTGLAHTPFSFPQAAQKARALAQTEESKKKKENLQKRKITSNTNPLGLKLEQVKKYNALWRTNQIGPDFQVDISNIPFYNLEDGDHYGDDDDNEELISAPIEEETVPRQFQGKPELLIKTIQEQYWKPIFLQFGGRIPYEVAMAHLKKCEFDFERALDTVDQKLREVPQEVKPLCRAQAMLLGKMVQKEKNTMRQIQEKALRNYHLGEVLHLREKFEKFYVEQRHDGVACTCHSLVHHETPFEPRVSCTNCNRNHRNPQDRARRCGTSESQKEWCLICQTYFKMAKRRRPADAVVFSERELEFIEIWNKKEAEQRRKLTRAQVEEQILAENTARWKRLELTEEEKAMVYEKNEFTGGNQELRGKRIAAKLQPFHLPLYTKCNCYKHGGVTRKSKNFEKWEWSAEEQKIWKNAIQKGNGDFVKIAKSLKVEPGLVNRFLRVHPMKQFDKRVPTWHTDLPPALPEDPNFGFGPPTAAELREERMAKRARIS